MTVTYIQHCHTAGKLGAFLRLLAIWRGSVFQVIWKDLVVFCSLYGLISLSYRLGFSRDESMKLIFEKVYVYFGKYGDYIPLAFILGFYVSQVVTRWFHQRMISRVSMLLLFQTVSEKTSNNNISKLWPLKKENKQTTSSKSNEKLQVVFLYLNENYLI